MRLLFILLALLLVCVVGCSVTESPTTPRGLLYVSTTDSTGNIVYGATILLNDIPQAQTTPTYIGPMTAGTYRMVIRKRSFTIVEQNVAIDAGDTTRAIIPLIISPVGWVNVTSTPSNARIILNQEYMTDRSGTPMRTPAVIEASLGAQEISVVLDGYLTVNPSLHRINVTADTNTIDFGLEAGTPGKAVGNIPFDYRRRIIGPDETRLDSINLEVYRGHLTMFTCWYTNCRPCRAELPYFDNYYRQFASQGVRFVALTTPIPVSQSYNQFLAAIAQINLSFPVLLDPQPGYFDGMVNHSPATYPLNVLVDTTGKIISTGGSIDSLSLRNAIISHLPH